MAQINVFFCDLMSFSLKVILFLAILFKIEKEIVEIYQKVVVIKFIAKIKFINTIFFESIAYF